MLVDVLNEFLNWDSKFFATIAFLIVKPWRLTNEFLAGHRVRYVHPLRLYLLASILFFFAVNYWAKSIPPTTLSDRDRAEIQAELKNEDLPPDARAKLEKALGLDSPAPTSATPNVPTPPGSPPEASTKTNQTLNKEGERAFFQSGNPQTPFEKWLETRAKEKMGAHGSNMQLFLRTLISNLPYMVLCCIPLFAFVLKVLYLRRKVLGRPVYNSDAFLITGIVFDLFGGNLPRPLTAHAAEFQFPNRQNAQPVIAEHGDI